MTKKILNKLEQFEQRQLKKIPTLKVGDSVRVHAKIKEGGKERVQVFEGILTRYAKGGLRSTITVRKVSFGIGVERVFPVHSPQIDRIERVSEGKIRQARLYYLRELRGRAARIEKWKSTAQGEEIVEQVGAVAAGPVIKTTASDEEVKKKATILDAAESQKKN